MAYATSNTIGVRLAAESATQEHELGTRVLATDGGELVYVQANGAITQYDAVGIDENYQAAALTTAMVDDGYMIGFAQIAFTDNYYGWVFVRGSNINCRVADSCAADVALYTTSTAGVLDDATTTSRVDGVVCVAANANTTTSNVEVIATWPRSNGF
jgi:acetylglutamate kinase